MSEAPRTGGFTPISPNPYIVGNPVRGRTMFFGREAEFDEVRRRFGDSRDGGLLVFCGERRSGKTSILFQILDQRLGPDFIPVLVDMQSMAIGSEDDFLSRIADEVLSALGPDGAAIAPPTFAPGTNHSAAFQKFIHEVLRQHPQKKLILLFDEYELFESKIDSGALSTDVINTLASLMENQPAFLVFTGSQHLDQRRREYWHRLLAKSRYKRISYLERLDALNLIRKPVEGRVQYPDDVVEQIYRLTAGQPFYTQAICQNIVDQINEKQSAQLTPDVLDAVVTRLVNNPLPQMIFLWDGLDRDEKLVLALLAEALNDERTHATEADLSRLVNRRYPLELGSAEIATALEKLFASEMLLKEGSPPRYAFRMDLWRLWIRRMHSVWQVMRELGLEIRKRKRPSWIGRVAIAVLAMAAFVSIVLRPGSNAGRRPVKGDEPAAAYASMTLDVEPPEATIYMDGEPVGSGSFQRSIVAGKPHQFTFSATGYADTSLPVTLEPRATDRAHLKLRPLWGAARIQTDPVAAVIEVDGRAYGSSPVTVPALAVARPHTVTAIARGYQARRQEFRVTPNATTDMRIPLDSRRVHVVFVTTPADADVALDGVALGAPMADLDLGTHHVSARHDGFQSLDTTLTVTESTSRVRLALVHEPPGALVIRGDDLAKEIYVDGEFKVDGVQNWHGDVSGGMHNVKVLLNQRVVLQSVLVKPGEEATYDYTKGTVTRRPLAAR